MTPPEDGGGSGETIHPTILREIGLVQRECTARHRRRNEDVARINEALSRHVVDIADSRERLVELTGRSGTGGKVAEIEKDISDMQSTQAAQDERISMNSSDINKMKASQFRWGAGGATVGGGTVMAIVELLRHYI